MDSLEPTAVPMPRARELLGDKSYSEIYEAIDEGKLVALKDGRKTSHHYRVHPLIPGGAAARARQSIGPTPGKAATTGPLTTINGAG